MAHMQHLTSGSEGDGTLLPTLERQINCISPSNSYESCENPPNIMVNEHWALLASCAHVQLEMLTIAHIPRWELCKMVPGTSLRRGLKTSFKIPMIQRIVAYTSEDIDPKPIYVYIYICIYIYM